MNRGKEICKELKGIRKAIAEENGIGMEFPECHHQGPCRGTCPRCEAELRQLEHELERRLSMGKVATVAGMALALTSPVVAGNSPMEAKSLPLPEYGTALPAEPDNTLLIPGLAPESEAKVLCLIVRDARTKKKIPLADIVVYKDGRQVGGAQTNFDGEARLKDSALDFDSLQVMAWYYAGVTVTRDNLMSLKQGEGKDGLKCLDDNMVEVRLKWTPPIIDVLDRVGGLIADDLVHLDPTPASQCELPKIEKQHSEGEAATNPKKDLSLRVVEDEKMTPIAFAHVYAYKDSTLLADGYTAEDGTIVLQGLEAEEVTVVVRKPGYETGEFGEMKPRLRQNETRRYSRIAIKKEEIKQRLGGVEPVPARATEIPDPTGIRLLKVQY